MPILELPAELIQKILELVADLEDTDSRYVCPVPSVRPVPLHARSDVARIRLVNRTFSSYATALIFCEIDARAPEMTPAVPLYAGPRLLQISRSSLVDRIRVLKLGLDTSAHAFGNRVMETLQEATYLVNACRKLRILDIKGPKERLIGVDFKTDEAQYDFFLTVLNHVFRMIHRRAGEGHLHTVNISLPLTHDYLDLMSGRASGLFPSVMASIRHLHVAVSDFSGPGGHRRYEKNSSSGQKTYPNRTNQQYFWDFIRLAANLHSLSIKCTHSLDFDLLSVRSFTNLRELKVEEVQMSEIHFLKIVRQNTATLTAIELHSVMLAQGLWYSLLLYLRSLHHLDHFIIKACGTLFPRSNSKRAWRMAGLHRIYSLLESPDTRDHWALGHLQRHVNSVRARAGLPLYPKDDYFAAALPSMSQASHGGTEC